MNIVTQWMNNNKFRGSVQLTFLVSSPFVVESMACVGVGVSVCVDMCVYVWVCGCESC